MEATESKTQDSNQEEPARISQAVIIPKQNLNLRHFKALMRKNAINWRRTILGSTLEILCPVLLMFLLVYIRTQVVPYLVGEYDVYQLKKPFYPTATLDNNSGNWTDTNFNTARRGLQLREFMDYTEYIGKVDIQGQSVYQPLLDPVGPYFFFPNHCTKRENQRFNRFASPVIAYVGQNNQIESDILAQIQLLMNKQKWMKNYIEKFTEAVSKPTDPTSLNILLQLFEGGTTSEILMLLTDFGLQSEMISAFQLASYLLQNQNLTQLSQNIQVTPVTFMNLTNLTSIQPLINQVSAFRANQANQLQNIANLTEIFNQNGLNQTQIIQLLNQTLIVRNATELQQMIPSLTAFNNSQLLNLTDQQQNQLNDLLNNQLRNTSIQELTQNNSTALFSQLQDSLQLSQEQNQTLQSLIDSAQPNQSFADLLQLPPANSLTTQLGLNESQVKVISETLQDPNAIFLNQTARDTLLNLQNGTLIQQISEQIGLNQSFTESLLRITTLQELAQVLQLSENQTQILLNITDRQEQPANILLNQTTINQVVQALNLTTAQQDLLQSAVMLLLGNTSTRGEQANNLTNQLPLNEQQQQIIRNISNIITGQLPTQSLLTLLNLTQTELSNQLGLTQQQSQILSDFVTFTSTQTLTQYLVNVTSLNGTLTNSTRDLLDQIAQRFGINTNQTGILENLISNQTDSQSFQVNSTSLLNQTQSLIESFAQNQSIQAFALEQLSRTLNLNSTLNQQIQTLISSANDTINLEQFGNVLSLNQTQIDILQQAIADQQQNMQQINFQPNTTQLTQVQNILQSLGQQNIQQNSLDFQELIWSFSPIDQQTVQYALTVAQNLSNGVNISSILSPQLEKFTKDTLTKEKLDLLSKNSEFKDFGNFYLQRFNSKEELDAYIEDPNYGWGTPGICFGFQVIENSDNDYEVELIFNDLPPSRYYSIPNQKKDGADPTVKYPLVKEYSYYVANGFSNLQNWFANTILKRKTGVSSAEIVAMVVPVKIPPVYQDNFVNLLQLTLTLFMLLMYIPAIYRTVYRIVYEKQSKAKESMRMMGMSDLPYWGSWLAYYTIVNTLISTLCWATLQLGVFNHKSALILFIFIWLYGQSLFGLILITQSIFTSPRACAITTTVVYFGTSLLEVLTDDADTPKNKKVAICWFFPTVTLANIIKPLVMFDQSTGNTFSSWNLQFQQFSVRDGLILFIVGGLNMFILGLYLEQVMPKTYGNRKHPLFFIGVRSCSCRKRNIKTVENRPSNISLREEDQSRFDFETKYLRPECFEPADFETRSKETTNQILKIADLKKEYENGFKAVNGINLKMYSDQIFVLLGHNGAGKTTTISILTGLFGATEGEASIFGVNIFNDMQRVRQIMGVCPQHDILFELLTTQEHLEFFYDLKGADPDPVKKKAEIDKLMQDVGVIDKRNSLASHLSGGNKRKLSVAIALCGGSKFVLLDEPTSGMDLQARRQLWNMLKECKKDRIVVLTTHYMDEADILGDRIGIMANGKLTCLGTSMFLKNKFGVGYNLTIVKSSTEPNPSILDFMHQKLGQNVRVQSEIQSEMTIQIPLQYAPLFADFFQLFDQELSNLKINSYGISISTLEEVFLKVGHLDDPTASKTFDNPSTQGNQSNGSEDLEQAQNMKDLIERERKQQAERFNLKDNYKELDESFLNNLTAVLYKRVSNYRRNRRAVFNEAILPAIIMIAGVTLTEFYPQWRSPSRILSPYRLPLPQKLLINPMPTVKGDVFVSDLVKGLPEFNSAFDIKYSQWNMTTSMREFGSQVYDHGNQMSVFPPYQYGSYQIYEANRATQQYKFISWVNLTSQDSTGLYPQFMYESILKTATNDSNFKFKTRLTTYPPTDAIKVVAETANSGTIVFMSAISYSMIITAIVSYLVVERISGLKHLQVISGMNLKAYWIGNFIFDLIKMELTIIVTIVLFFGYKMDLNAAWATYIALPFGIIPFSYVMSYWFTVDSAAQTFTMFFHFFILGIMSTLTFGLRISPDNQHKGDLLNWILKLIPTYSVGSSLYCDTACESMSWQRDNVKGTGGPINPNVWATTNNTADIVVMFIHLFVWSVILSFVENGYFSWFRFRPNAKFDSKSQSLDDDVIKEAERVQALQFEGFDQDVVAVKNLKKVYRVPQSKIPCKSTSLLAVSDLSFALQSGECFALLGVNGAGKSTTFKSLTREVQPTSGQISIGGFDVQREFMQARKLMGYCPQPNLIFDSMSVEEHIYYYAKIKGIPMRYRSAMVELQIKTLGLETHRKKTAGTLSGGNKRKLCVAIALVGNPPIIFLDEPSAGMDPEARRFMWSVVAKIAERKTSAIVLTTHSMEEAEALSTKMGIMVKGGIFKCFGSAQHIRNKFGTGYVIEIKIKSLLPEELYLECQGLLDSFTNKPNFESTNFDLSVQQQIQDSLIQDSQDSDYKRKVHSEFNLYNCISQLCQTFNDVQLIEKYGNYIRVKVQRLDRSIGSVFSLLETFKSKYSVSEYSVSQTTLEQIFQSFADPTFNESAQTFRLIKTEFATLPSLLESGSKVIQSEQKPKEILTIVKKLA